MNFRRFKLRDLEDVVAIENECFSDPFSEITILFLNQSCRIYVGIEEDVVSFLILGYVKENEEHMYRIATKRSHQKMGIGSMLIKKYVKRKCSVITKALNNKAIRFYMDNGFKVKKEFVKDSTNEKMMLLELADI